MSYLDGKILSQTAPRHRHTEWLRFLQQLERAPPPELALHLIMDNYATHKHARVKAWLARHPRFHLHFTPTGSPWLNLVERFFRDLTVDVVREGSFGSVPELVTAMADYLAERNLNPKRYVWRAAGADILAKTPARPPKTHTVTITVSMDTTLASRRIFSSCMPAFNAVPADIS